MRRPDTMQMTGREFLSIYIYVRPKTEIAKEYNKEMLEKAEAIRSIRVQSVINKDFAFLDKGQVKANFLDFFSKSSINSGVGDGSNQFDMLIQ